MGMNRTIITYLLGLSIQGVLAKDKSGSSESDAENESAAIKEGQPLDGISKDGFICLACNNNQPDKEEQKKEKQCDCYCWNGYRSSLRMPRRKWPAQKEQNSKSDV